MFIARQKLRLVSLDGGNVQEISTDVIGYPGWSPDGSMLAYLRDRDAGFIVLEVITADGGYAGQSAIYQRSNPQPWIYDWTKCD